MAQRPNNSSRRTPKSEETSASHVITKDTLDSHIESVSSKADRTSVLSSRFRPDEHITINYSRVYYSQPVRSQPLTKVIEKSHLMQWQGQKFKCRIGITLENSTPDSDWTIGLAQACDYLELSNQFEAAGRYQWEFHPTKSGLHKMVNDSNGLQWPFYSHETCLLEIVAGRPLFYSSFELHFSDFFYPTMQWGMRRNKQTSWLTDVERVQHFKVWLVAIKRGKNHPKDGFPVCSYSQFRPELDELYVLQAMEWKYHIGLKFDCHMPLGRRCKSINDAQSEQPRVLQTVDPIPTSALVPPNCNSCQSLIFYPQDKNDVLLLKAKPADIVVPWDRWREDMTMGYSNVANFNCPTPLPNLFPCYSGDPLLESKFSSNRSSTPTNVVRRGFASRCSSKRR
ncbi:hypothetical protein BOX15_Mlig029804g1 [Macrostomum lignano]|uniref:Uncharacterized protein n=1 Tax=Macrostomum lignano TaxID=282301 RepID=A0A267EBQ1_9PLAT|nr:hypothetical protein BOX15_Mlig029804g1 [Macrostomum lignano]